MVERRLPIRTATVMAGDLLVNAFESFAARPEAALDDVADSQLSRAPVASQQTRGQRPFTLIVPPPARGLEDTLFLKARVAELISGLIWHKHDLNVVTPSASVFSLILTKAENPRFHCWAE